MVKFVNCLQRSKGVGKPLAFVSGVLTSMEAECVYKGEGFNLIFIFLEERIGLL